MNFFKKFQIGLKKTSSTLSANILNVLSSQKIDNDTLDELESILISSDIGLEVTNQLISKIKLSKITNPKNPKEILLLLRFGM